jgi:hypothetical protein
LLVHLHHLVLELSDCHILLLDLHLQMQVLLLQVLQLVAVRLCLLLGSVVLILDVAAITYGVVLALHDMTKL